MELLTWARVLHVLGVIFWIGGVAMVTTVLIPLIRKTPAQENSMKTFEKIEGRFSVIAKIAVLLTGITGFYMLYLLDGWNRYLDVRFWWVHAMTITWLLFTIMLFVIEPLVLHKIIKKKALENPEKIFSRLQRMHWILLMLSLITIIGAVAGSHGIYFFG